MTYRQLQQLAKTLRNQGLIAKSFKLNQKAEILKAEIERVNGKIEAAATTTPAPKKKTITQEEFNHNFTQGYVELMHEEELEGVVTMRVPDVRKKLFNLYKISARTFNRMYKKVPTLFEIPENGHVMCRIATKEQADGTYKPEH